MVYLVVECKQARQQWEDAVKKDAPHWKPRVTGDEKQATRLEETRKALKNKLKDKDGGGRGAKPTLGSVLVGDLKFDSTKAQAIVDRIKGWVGATVWWSAPTSTRRSTTLTSASSSALPQQSSFMWCSWCRR